MIYAQSDIVQSYKYSGAISVRQPILVDSVNIKGKSFGNKELLDTRIDVNKALKASSILSTDTNGVLSFISDTSEYQLHIFAFQLNSDGFNHAKIVVTATDMVAVYFNNEKKKEKTTTDTFSSISFEVNLLNGCNNFYIRYLSNKKNNNENLLKVVFTADSTGKITQCTNDTKRLYDFKTLMDGKNIRQVQISPNGKYALINFTERKNTQIESYVQLIDITTQKVILQDKSYLLSARWLPTTNSLYFTRKGMKGRELVSMNPVDLQQVVIDNNLPEGNFAIAPNEQTLIFSLKDEGEKRESKAMQRILDPYDRQQGWRNRTYLAYYDIKTGVLERLTFGSLSTHLYDISSDSRYILYGTAHTDYTQRPFSTTNIYQLDLLTLKVDTLFWREKYISKVTYSPDNQQLLIMAGPEAFDGIGANLGKEKIGNSYDNQLYIYTIANKQILPITKKFNPSVNAAFWSDYNNTIYVLAEDRDYQHLFSISAQGEIKKLDNQEDYVKSFSVSNSSSSILYYGQSVSNADRCYVINGKKGKSTLVLDISAEKLQNVVLGTMYDWNFYATDSTLITGRYYLPPYFDSTKTYPMLVYYYGGTSPTSRLLEHSYAMHLYAVQGYVVYTLNPSGTTGFGQEFSARHVNAWGQRTADEIILGVKQFCKEHAFVDKNHIGCFGASYGGFMTQYLLTQTDIFAAAISHAGISAISSYWGEGYWGIGYCSIANADSYPWNNSDLYIKQSPLFNADKINTPLLLLHGMVDTNVPIGESIQMYNALKILGKEVEFIQVEGENHGISDYKKRLEWTNTIMAWFAKYLKNDAQWWNNIYLNVK